MKHAPPSPYELCFRSLFHSGRGFSFPCDAGGQVQLDALSERARINYLYARAMVGRELAAPAVESASCGAIRRHEQSFAGLRHP